MSATDINDWPGHLDADPDCECCLGDGLQADGETPCPCIDARKGEDLTFETETPRAWLDVMGERVRQITAEGWTTEHDDTHVEGEPAGVAGRARGTGMTDSYTITAAELRQFIEQIEQLEAEKKDISAQIGEIYSAAKARGYDQKALKVIVKMRAADKDELAEQEAILDIYKSALGMV